MKHLGIDIETLAVTPHSVVLSVAAVGFDFEEALNFNDYKAVGLHLKLDPIEQIKSGRTVDPETVKWWKKQGEKAAKILQPSSNDLKVGDALERIEKFIKTCGYDWRNSYIWTRGLNFDIPIIEDLFRQGNKPVPYNTWKTRDIRTYIDVLTGSTDGKYTVVDSLVENFTAHSALDDICMDVIRMKEIYRKVYSD